jgi:hypothetical protein
LKAFKIPNDNKSIGSFDKRLAEAERRVPAEAMRDSEAEEQRLKALLRMYNKIREHPTSHPSSWSHRGIKTGYDGKGCNQYTGCVPECSFYPPMQGVGQKEEMEYYIQAVLDYEVWRDSIGQPLYGGTKPNPNNK